ncbi:MAG: DUF5011 domain-containing protein [Euryarchaeota archaeon]|nr:DUF5011 domain-containing protein [Euryarchaeota archaeon]
MARRRREDDKKAEMPFEVPEFDESEYIRRETISFRTTLILFLYSIVTAAVSFGVWLAIGATERGWFLALLIGAVLGYLLRYIYPALKVDVSHFGKKDWTGTGFLYFFSWLAFFIFFTNPPLYDGVDPDVGLHITPDLQEAGAPVNITVFAIDNLKVVPDSLEFRVTGPGGTDLGVPDLWHDPEHESHWGLTFTPPEAGEYTITATVADSRGRESTETRTLRVADDVIEVQLDDGGRFTRDTNRVIVRITEDRPEGFDLWHVRLAPTDGSAAIIMERDRDDDTWVVEATHERFKELVQGGDDNVTFRVEAVEHDSYLLARDHGLHPIETPLVSNETYTVTFADESVLGDDTTKTPKRLPAPARQVPAPGAFLAVGALVAVVAVARSRRRD